MNNFLAPYMTAIKLAVILILVATASYFSWDYRGAKIQAEVDEAVNDATRETTRMYENERERRLALQAAIDTRYETLLQRIEKIKISSTVNNNTIIREVESNPEFYSQPLPQKGYQAWITARSLMQAPAPAAPASASR